MLSQLLEANRLFLQNDSSYYVEQAQHMGKIPSKACAILSCMDTRLIDLLEAALGLRRGEAVIIKNAGNCVTSTFETTVLSLLIAIFEQDVQEIIVVGHADCGVSHAKAARLMKKMIARGIAVEAITMIYEHMRSYLDQYHKPHDNVRKTVHGIRHNPLIPSGVVVHGLLLDPVSGKVSVVEDGYTSTAYRP